jgi:hypothetical protein
MTKKITIKHLKLLILLNAFDGIATYMGVLAGYIEEWNPLMQGIVSNFCLLILVKIAIPTLILTAIIALISSGRYLPGEITKKLIKGSLLAYTTVLLIHISWISKVVI